MYKDKFVATNDKLVLEVGQLIDMARGSPYYEPCCGLLAPFMSQEDRDKAIALLFEKELFDPLGKLLSVESPKRATEVILSRKGQQSCYMLINTFISYLNAVDRASLTDEDKQTIWNAARELLVDCPISSRLLAYDATHMLYLLRDFAPTGADVVSVMYGIADSAICNEDDSQAALEALSDFACRCPDLAEKYIDDFCELLRGVDRAKFIVSAAESRPRCKALIDKFISAINEVVENDELMRNGDVRFYVWDLIERVCRISTENIKLLWPAIIKALDAFCRFESNYLSVALFSIMTPVALDHVYDFIDIIKRGLYEFHITAKKEQQHEDKRES